jgi:hypothetical protein
VGPEAPREEQLSGQLEELGQRLPALAADLDALGKLRRTPDVNSGLNKIRFITEKVLHDLCRRHGVTWGDAEPTLERMLGPLTAEQSIPKPIAPYVHTIQKCASPGSHYQEIALSPAHVTLALQALVEFLQWYWEATVLEPGSGRKRRRARPTGTKKRGAREGSQVKPPRGTS